ncbi:hypothetical protein D3C79_1102650 [compost metagenome]
MNMKIVQMAAMILKVTAINVKAIILNVKIFDIRKEPLTDVLRRIQLTNAP